MPRLFQSTSTSPFVPINTITLSEAVNVIDIPLTGNYDVYKLEVNKLGRTTAQNGNIVIRCSADGGSTFDEGVSAYSWSGRYNHTASTSVAITKSTGNSSGMVGLSMLGGIDGEFSGEIIIDDALDVSRKTRIRVEGTFKDTASRATVISTVITHETGGLVDAVRILTGNTDTMENAVIKLLGMNL